jgi:hypothetical protein
MAGVTGNRNLKGPPMLTFAIARAIPRLVTVGTFCFFVLAGSRTAAAGPVIYFYQGNALETSGTYQCPPVCNVSGSFIVASELEANRTLEPGFTPLWYSFSNGLNTFTAENSTMLGGGFFVSTTAQSIIDEWSIQLVSSSPTTYLETFHTPSGFVSVSSPTGAFETFYTADWTFVYGCTPTTCSPIGTGLLANNPGTWTSMPFAGELPSAPVPEPGTLLLVGSGLALALKRHRRPIGSTPPCRRRWCRPPSPSGSRPRESS